MRRPIIVGTHKLYISLKESTDFASALLASLDGAPAGFDLVVVPSMFSLAHVSEILTDSGVYVGAQDVHAAGRGPLTGQSSLADYRLNNITHAIVCHSELYENFALTRATVGDRVRMCLANDVDPIVCFGESREERGRGASADVVAKHLRDVLKGTDPDTYPVKNVVIAYEPVWAIQRGGQGSPAKKVAAATVEQVVEMHGTIRQVMASLYGDDVAQAVRIAYGGSANADNAEEFLRQEEVDGLLVGRASSRITSFLPLVEAATRSTSAGYSKQAVDA